MKHEVILKTRHQFKEREFPAGTVIGIVNVAKGLDRNALGKSLVKVSDGFDAARVQKCVTAGVADLYEADSGKADAAKAAAGEPGAATKADSGKAD